MSVLNWMKTETHLSTIGCTPSRSARDSHRHPLTRRARSRRSCHRARASPCSPSCRRLEPRAAFTAASERSRKRTACCLLRWMTLRGGWWRQCNKPVTLAVNWNWRRMRAIIRARCCRTVSSLYRCSPTLSVTTQSPRSRPWPQAAGAREARIPEKWRRVCPGHPDPRISPTNKRSIKTKAETSWRSLKRQRGWRARHRRWKLWTRSNRAFIRLCANGGEFHTATWEPRTSNVKIQKTWTKRIRPAPDLWVITPFMPVGLPENKTINLSVCLWFNMNVWRYTTQASTDLTMFSKNWSFYWEISLKSVFLPFVTY